MSTHDDDAQKLRNSVQSVQGYWTQRNGPPWWSASELVSRADLTAVDADHIEACAPERIARVLSELDRLRSRAQELERAVAQEREECALTCDQQARDHHAMERGPKAAAARLCAAGIRARGAGTGAETQPEGGA